jgi:type IV secretory pathway VirB10-like protein
MTDQAPGTAPVTDRRVAPRGVLPRGIQTWLMLGLALAIVVVILITGHPDPPVRRGPRAAPDAPSTDRVRDYHERLQAMEVQETEQKPDDEPSSPVHHEMRQQRPRDPLAAERHRREYESLFASNVVLSRRPERERPDAGRFDVTSSEPAVRDEPTSSSIDEIADAVVRATLRAGATPAAATASPVPQDQTSHTAGGSKRVTQDDSSTRAQRDSISGGQSMHRLVEGTIIDAVLANRLDGSLPAPVNCLVTNPVYSQDRQHVVIPAGARLLGETKPVQAQGQTRLAVGFHRLVLPNGQPHSLEQFPGLNQIGDAGLRDRVNHHYWSTFGAAGAVGLITGLAQYLGTGGLVGGDGDRTVIIAGGADATAQASLQVMNRFLNRLPTVTIREGHRVKVYLTSDLKLPAYQTPAMPGEP